jgi:hypothetical protein
MDRTFLSVESPFIEEGGFFTNGILAMKNPDALRIFFPECFGGKYKSLKKHNSRRIISSIS